MFCYSAYIAAQFYPQYYTLIPTAFLLGLGAAPMWSAKCSYLTQVATYFFPCKQITFLSNGSNYKHYDVTLVRTTSTDISNSFVTHTPKQVGELYGNIVGEDSEVIITRFFGIFFLFFQSSQVWGNIISSTVLSAGVENLTRSEEFLEICGADFCPAFAANLTASSSGEPETDEEKSEDRSKIYLMASIYLCCSIASVLIIAIFVDPLSKLNIEEKIDSNSRSGKELLVATFLHMQKINQILIIPLTMWSGFEQAFLGADFTAAFVSCGLGVHMVGYVMICYGVCDAVCSLCFSPLVKIIGRVPIFTFGAVVNFAMFTVMALWKPHPTDYAIFFIVASLWGIADAIWQTQINAFYGVIFPGEAEAAFSNYRLWESAGFILAYVWSGIICVELKIYILIGILSFAMVGYYIIEFLERKGGLVINNKKIINISDLAS
ncbi:UNC93-like protein [Armadillidium nasatum]|uniref:UNC93-like protein n=1 Tax=Armadillidium nasatum TaxID=96803 RepID=A0A5N5SNW9_9CRUS|nr:UNC93-like protein [Armadillidium nasatum]